MIKPRKLRPGDKVAAVTLSWGGPATFSYRYEIGKRQFSDEFEVEVVEARHALRDADWLLRNPKARADDLMECFGDRSIAGIISTIGGHESLRLWPHVDLNIIRSNPKVFLAENCGMFPYMVESLRRTIFSSEPVGTIEPNRDGWTVEHLDWANPENQQRRRRLEPSTGWRFLQGAGKVQGHLIGGCVEVLQMLRGTPAWPAAASFDDAILFLETSEEGAAPQYVTGELRSYARMGV
jgi:muramoyltetrapeptide carboxypeptidase LdcA involved in peptidoglycan recycling